MSSIPGEYDGREDTAAEARRTAELRRDDELVRNAEKLVRQTDALNRWVRDFGEDRDRPVICRLQPRDKALLLRMRRRARSLWASARVPAAAAVYGPSQVGKSLFIGRILSPLNAAQTPLGSGENPSGGPREISFMEDLNPRNQRFEATALVTRFTTKNRMPAGAAGSQYPVMVRALTRAQWLCVLARGFLEECAGKPRRWDHLTLERKLSELRQQFGAPADVPGGDEWRNDLLDAYCYVREEHEYVYEAEDYLFNGLLGVHPLDERGYIALAAELFWGGWAELTELFRKVASFLRSLAPPEGTSSEDASLQDSFLMVEWEAVRFLLDSQRQLEYESPGFGQVRWEDFRLQRGEQGGCLLTRRSGSGRGESLEIIQAALLEMLIPVLPERLNEDWRPVLQNMDLLDIPGIKLGRAAAVGGKRPQSELSHTDSQLEIVKRGKVSYLFARYTAEKQIQTLLMLLRGGNIDVGGPLSQNLNGWGRSRFERQLEHAGPGQTAWYHFVDQDPPPLFLGMTGFDEDFRNSGEAVMPAQYDVRFRELKNALGSELFDDFGTERKSFANLYLIRYPGSWDANAAAQEREGQERWKKACESFCSSPLMKQYVAEISARVKAAMQDADGGLSLISAGFLKCTDNAQKRDELARAVKEVREQLGDLAESWYVSEDRNVLRAEREALGAKLIAWLKCGKNTAHHRVHAVKESLSVKEGQQYELSDLRSLPAGLHAEAIHWEGLFDLKLRAFLKRWATELAPAQWTRHVKEQQGRPEGEAAKAAEADVKKCIEHRFPPGFDDVDFRKLALWLHDYLVSPDEYPVLLAKLFQIANLNLLDQAALRHARRKYIRMVLNDYIMNPGSTIGVVELPPSSPKADGGLMAEFIGRWSSRLPLVLAAGAGADTPVPPGNKELGEFLRGLGRRKPPGEDAGGGRSVNGTSSTDPTALASLGRDHAQND